MKTIVFDRKPHVYLPEITAYIDFINNNLDGWQGYDSKYLGHYNPNDFDVMWRFMGFDRTGEGRTVIHEYNSLSTGMLPGLKNQIKKMVNVKPAARIFLNDIVKSHFGFKDNIPNTVRDMGINKQFFINAESQDKEYDFVYSGSLTDRGSIIFKALEHFTSDLNDASLLVIGNVPDDIHKEFGTKNNITFTGRLAYADVPAAACKARYGLNLMPDIFPLNTQTATKVIEYCALGLPIVTSDYGWVRHFEQTRQGAFYFLKDDFSNFTLRDIEPFVFDVPAVDDLEWDSLIRNSGVFDLLENLT